MRIFGRALVAIGFCLVAAGVVAAGESVVRVAQVADITNLDPHKAGDIYTANVIRQIYNNLVKMNKEMEVQGDLAERWINPDDKSWVFTLRKGVKFHNGETLTAEDVKYTFDRMLAPASKAPGKRLVDDVDKVEVVDPLTVKITTKKPFAPLLTNLTRYEMAILSKKAVEQGGADYGKKPVGTGPFVFREHRLGDRVVLVKFPGYFEGPAKIDQIVYRAIPEDATRVVEIESGGIDLMYNAPPQDFDRLAKNPKLTAIEELFQATMYLGMNLKVKPFDNKLVRQAINYAVDKEAIDKAVYFGRATPSYGPLSPSIWGFDRGLKPAYPYNPQKAKELLKQAGYGAGFECVIWTDPRTERKSVAEMVQAYLAQVGVTAKIEIMEWGKLLSETGKGAKGMFVLGWTGTGDADGGLHIRFHTSGIGKDHNRNQWGTAELDQLLEAGRTTMDPAKRKAVYAKIQRLLVEEAPDLFINISKNLAVARKELKGFELYPTNINPLYGVSYAK
jgi:peptide/nickel transport system substrate-binding protein